MPRRRAPSSRTPAALLIACAAVVLLSVFTSATPLSDGAAPAHAQAVPNTATLMVSEIVHSNGAELKWTFSGDKSTFQKYEVHRSATTSFTPSAATLLATISDVDSTSFIDTTAAAAKTFRYKLVVDGTASNEVSATLPAAGLATMTLQPDAKVGKASQLVFENGITLCADYGASGTMRVGTGPNRKHRPILAFNLRKIPALATVSSATLTLWYAGDSSATGTAIGTIDLYRVTRAWKEGTGTGACTGAGVTWYETEGGVDWAGGGNSVSAGIQIAKKSRTTPGSDSINVRSLVQEWANGTNPDFGILMRLTDETLASGRSFTYYTDDHASASQRPKLAVTYADGSAALAPRVAIGRPAPNARILSAPVTITASASDDQRVDKVEFLVGGVVIGTDTIAPYSATWTPTSADNGTRALTARATDDAGNVATSAAVNVTVDLTALPTAAVTAPAGGATVSGNVTVTATASDDTGVKVVEFYIDGNRFADDTTAPYSVTWNTLDGLLPAFDGTHALTARAYDPSGQSKTSAAVNVTVANGANTQYKATFDLGAPGPEDDELVVPQIFKEDPYAPTGGGSGSQQTLQTQSLESVSASFLESGPRDSGGDRDPTSPPANPIPIDVTITNTSTVAWKGGDLRVWYRWYRPDGTILYEGPAADDFPQTVQPGQSKLLHLNIVSPALPAGTELAQYTLRFDIWDAPNLKWFAFKGNKPVDNPVIVNKTLGRALGLERFYHYTGANTGAGMSHLVNVANGNSLLRWTPFNSPGRGLSTVLDLTYNSLEDHSESPVGNNWSLSVSSLTRFGLPIDIHPKNADTNCPNTTSCWIELTDGDGTTHHFTGHTAGDGTIWFEEPAGVHLWLRRYSMTDPTRRWALTRPDRVTFFYDSEGYPTGVRDRNGNTITFALEVTPPAEDPGGPKKRITSVTDPGGRAFAIDYYSKAESKKPQIRGKIELITDHEGHALRFAYYEDGNLLRITQVGGEGADGSYLADRSFIFVYTKPASSASACLLTNPQPCDPADPDPKNPSQSTRLFSVRDPRGNPTVFDYYLPGEDSVTNVSKLQWKLQSQTDRAGSVTSYGYDITSRVTTVTAPLSRVSRFAYDTVGRVTQITNPKSEVTRVAWTTDNHVGTITEANNAATAYTYNANGYVTQVTLKDRNGVAIKTNQLIYDNLQVVGESGAADSRDSAAYWETGRSIPHISQLAQRIDGRGNTWLFRYDNPLVGNLVRVVEPEPAGLPEASRFTTRVEWNLAGSASPGTIRRTIDANGHATDFQNYDANGLPKDVIDALGQKTHFEYDADGLLLSIQDARHPGSSGGDPRHYRTVFDYDDFHRLGRSSTPKSTKGAGGLLIWSATRYDANDNVVAQVDQQFGYGDPGKGPTTTVAYDAMDRQTRITGPDTSADPAGERTEFVYDVAGRLTRITRPNGVKTTAIANDYATVLTYDLLDRVVKQTRYRTDASGAIVETMNTHFCYDNVGNLVSRTAPRAAVDTVNCVAPPPFTTTYTYDDAHRRLTVTDPEQRQTSTKYDKNDNVVETTDADNHVQQRCYDLKNQVVKVITPFNGARKVTTLIRYDGVGNRTELVSPRAYDAGGGQADCSSDSQNFARYKTTYEYDAVDRLTTVRLPFSNALPEEAGFEQHYIHYAYDANGNMTDVSLPSTAASLAVVPAELKSSLAYFDPGWIRRSNDHVNPAVTFDYTAQGWQRERTPDSADEPGVPDKSEQMIWAYYDDGMLKQRRERGGQPATYFYDADNNLTKAIDLTGLTNVTTASAQKRYELLAFYDSLDRVTEVRHRQATAESDTTTNYTTSEISYDLDNNVIKRIEDRTRPPGATATSTGGRSTWFTYDDSDRLDLQFDNAGTTGCTDDRKIDNDFTNTGLESLRQIYRGVTGCTNPPLSSPAAGWQLRQTTSWTYFENGKLRHLETKQRNPSTGALDLAESHDVTYEDPSGLYVNGHRTGDDVFLKGPAGSPTQCQNPAAPCQARYTYDPRDRLVKYVDGHGGTTTYTLDPVGNITREVSPTETRTSVYAGTRLEQSTVAGLTSKYWYDPSGNVDCVTTATGTQANCSPSNNGAASSSLLADYAYDPLDRLLSMRSFAGGTQTDSADYTYDALDRTVKEVEDHTGTANDRTTTFNFLALSGLVTKETQTAGTTTTTRSYSYDAYGHRISLARQVGTGAVENYNYGYDVHGSVSLLLNDGGSGAKASYGYTPYGQIDSALTKGDANATDPDSPPLNPVNPYRFSARRLDTGSNTVDMGARRFGPDVARFLQQDVLAGALSDLGLSLDPLTGNRYSLAGANPLSFVEADGHYLAKDGGGGGSTASDQNEPTCVQRGGVSCTKTAWLASSFDQRQEWLKRVNETHQLDGWLDVFVGTVEYLEDSDIFGKSQRMKDADAVVLYTISQGLAEATGEGPASSSAGAKWASFFRRYFETATSGEQNEGELKRLWGEAETEGVREGLAFTEAKYGDDYPGGRKERTYTAIFTELTGVYRAGVRGDWEVSFTIPTPDPLGAPIPDIPVHFNVFDPQRDSEAAYIIGTRVESTFSTVYDTVCYHRPVPFVPITVNVCP